MATRHRKMGRKLGDEALADLKEELHATMVYIKDMDEFGLDIDNSTKNTDALKQKFPALNLLG